MKKIKYVKRKGVSIFFNAQGETVKAEDAIRMVKRCRNPRGLLADMGCVLEDEVLVIDYDLGDIRRKVMACYGNVQHRQVVCADIVHPGPFVPFGVNKPYVLVAELVQLWKDGVIEPGTVYNLVRGVCNLCCCPVKRSSLYEFAKAEVRAAQRKHDAGCKFVTDAPVCFVQGRFEKEFY